MLSRIRSTAAPSVMLCRPLLRTASVYHWNEVQWKLNVLGASSPPLKVDSPTTSKPPTVSPGTKPSDVSAAFRLIAPGVWPVSASTRLIPKRDDNVELALTTCDSPSDSKCLR